MPRVLHDLQEGICPLCGYGSLYRAGSWGIDIVRTLSANDHFLNYAILSIFPPRNPVFYVSIFICLSLSVVGGSFVVVTTPKTYSPDSKTSLEDSLISTGKQKPYHPDNQSAVTRRTTNILYSLYGIADRRTENMTSVSASAAVTPPVLYTPMNSTDVYIPYGINGSLYVNTTSPNGTDLFGNITNTTLAPPEDEQPPIPYQQWEQIIVAVILGALIICTIIGNCLVCISVAIVKRLQSPSNLLIVSLAVADLFVGMTVMPFAAVRQLYGSWILGTIVCDIWTTTDVLLCTSSILNLCAISVDRYFVITRPFQYAMKRTPKRMGLMVFIVWTVSAVVSIPPVFGWKSPHKPYDCIISDDIGYQIYATLCAFYLPLIVMICVYFKIWRVSSKIAKAEAKSKIGSFDKGAEFQLGRPSHDSGDSSVMPNGCLRDGVTNGGGGDDDGSIEILPKKLEPEKSSRRRFTIRSLIPRQPKLSNTKERKATKTLGIIMGCFTLCWLPFFILVLVSTFCRECQVPMELASVLNWLGYANSFLNPVIYARFNREFRTPFKEILLLRCRGINTRMRSESYVEQYGPVVSHRDSLRPPTDSVVRYNSQGQTVVALGNANIIWFQMSYLFQYRKKIQNIRQRSNNCFLKESCSYQYIYTCTTWFSLTV
ncbi:5-hydroxytryptamine receptor 1A [Aplysia californica]|uniref:5-hydroxytryptamine receptor 1A n=2 Tax=Euthyneura TaxID=216307 RepID=A0ABM1VWR8_APLCA|nr:5-hydroxytryptamine receptor 1A [Aplysia californica]